MKTIGLIGGMSWESSAMYYELLNKRIKGLLGGFHSSKCILVSIDFAEIEDLPKAFNMLFFGKKYGKTNHKS